jgi:flagellar basal-body rod protein FlgF/flagellar basal-body rod protein FlgG
LVTAQGYRVLSDAGEPIVLDATRSWTVHDDGFIQQSGGGALLGLAKPASLGDLARRGHNLFMPLGPLEAVPLPERRVVDGYLEMSDVRAARAMMELIETSRVYEANIKMIQNQDQMTGALVNRILRQS